jgi:hypothetical protein
MLAVRGAGRLRLEGDLFIRQYVDMRKAGGAVYLIVPLLERQGVFDVGYGVKPWDYA